MNYIIFYSNKNYFYCYSDDDKIYRGENKNFKPGIVFFLAPLLTRILLAPLNEYLQPLLDNKLSFFMIFVGIVVAIFISFFVKKKIKKTGAVLMTEIDLTPEQFETYISAGKKLFKKQFWILYVFVLLATVLFVIFLIDHSFSSYLFGFILTVSTSLLLHAISPLKKYRFFKQMTNRT